MKVKDLIKILETVDQELPIATHANNHSYFSVADEQSHGKLKISLCHNYSGNYILIGNQSAKNLNASNWHIIKDVRV